MQKPTLPFMPLSSISRDSDGVDVWLLDFSQLTKDIIGAHTHILSAEELTRAQTIKRNQDYFLASRVLIRKILSIYTQQPSHTLEFSRSAKGKPLVVNAPHPVCFNLSHSGNFAVLAVTTAGEVGVDIETIRPRNFLAITERYFHRDELAQFLAQPEAESIQLFFKLWTLKEAFFKATGSGISSGLDKAVFDLSGNSIAARFEEELNIEKNEWQFQQEFINPNTLFALAVQTTTQIQHQWFNANALLGN